MKFKLEISDLFYRGIKMNTLKEQVQYLENENYELKLQIHNLKYQIEALREKLKEKIEIIEDLERYTTELSIDQLPDSW